MFSASVGSKCTINISAEITVLKYTDDSLMFCRPRCSNSSLSVEIVLALQQGQVKEILSADLDLS